MLHGPPPRAPAARLRAAEAIAEEPERDSRLRRLARVALRGDDRQRFVHDWRRTLAGEPALPPGPIRHVALVCAGNICRSPIAAALLAALRPELQITSHGLATTPGRPADPRAVAQARERGLDLSGHRTRGFQDADARADLIVAMDVVQARAIARRWPEARERIRLLGDHLPRRPFAILDPFARSDAFWRHACERLAIAVQRLAERLEAGR